MQCNADGIALIKEFEGCVLHSYQDGNGIWTIGWGHTEGVKPNQWITQEQADILLDEDVEKVAEDLTAMLGETLTSNQFSAICSFVFNIGIGNFAGSTAHRYIEEGNLAGVPAAMAMWNKVAGEVSNGLVKRRAAERRLWNTA